MNLEKSRNAEYKKCAALLSLLVGLDVDAEEKRFIDTFKTWEYITFFFISNHLNLTYPRRLLRS